MYKLIHIHTDFKFLSATLRYVNPQIYNEVVFIGDVDDSIVDILQKLQLPYQTFNKTEIDKIAEVVATSDGVVFYNLDKIKEDLLEKLDPNIKVFLRFFGYELYSQLRNKYVSKATLKLQRPITLQKYGTIGYLKRKAKRFLGIEYSINKKHHEEIYSKIDAILLVNKFEYEELRRLFYLPKFIQLPLTRETPKLFDLSHKSDEIILGNSRHGWNNHLDILRIIKKTKKWKNYKWMLFFNYGSNNYYTDTVRREANQKNIVLLENFLSIENFNKIYDNATALVINSYRQHALGNIYTAILNGSKVYLNKKSSTYTWLKYEGFYISEINELPRDIDNNKIKLTIEEYQHNINCYNQMKANYTNINFIENIITVLKNE